MTAIECSPQLDTGGSEFGRISPALSIENIDSQSAQRIILFEAPTDDHDSPEVPDYDEAEIETVISIDNKGPARPPIAGEYPRPSYRKVDIQRRQRIFRRQVLKHQ